MHINWNVYKKSYLMWRTTHWLAVIAQLMWIERAMHKMAQKHKLFIEKHDRKKVNFRTVIYFYKILNDAHAHTHTQTYDNNFFPIHQLENGFCIIAQINKNVLYKYFPKNWTQRRGPPYGSFIYFFLRIYCSKNLASTYRVTNWSKNQFTTVTFCLFM